MSQGSLGLLNTSCPSWVCSGCGHCWGAEIMGVENVTEESQEGLVTSYRRGVIKRQIAQRVENTEIILKR